MGSSLSIHLYDERISSFSNFGCQETSLWQQWKSVEPDVVSHRMFKTLNSLISSISFLDLCLCTNYRIQNNTKENVALEVGILLNFEQS